MSSTSTTKRPSSNLQHLFRFLARGDPPPPWVPLPPPAFLRTDQTIVLMAPFSMGRHLGGTVRCKRSLSTCGVSSRVPRCVAILQRTQLLRWAPLRRRHPLPGNTPLNLWLPSAFALAPLKPSRPVLGGASVLRPRVGAPRPLDGHPSHDFACFPSRRSHPRPSPLLRVFGQGGQAAFVTACPPVTSTSYKPTHRLLKK